jgi:hypothetical protein
LDIAVPPGERRNKTPVYVSGVKEMRKFLDWVRAKSGKLAVQMGGEYLMLVPETAGGFRATISALRSLGEVTREFSHLFTPRVPMRAPIVEKSGQDHARNLHQVGAGGTAHSSSGRCATPIAATGPGRRERPSPHYNVSVARGPDVAKVRFLTELCCLRIKVETYKCKRCQRFGYTQRNSGYALRCEVCIDTHSSGTFVIP